MLETSQGYRTGLREDYTAKTPGSPSFFKTFQTGLRVKSHEELEAELVEAKARVAAIPDTEYHRGTYYAMFWQNEVRYLEEQIKKAKV